MNNTALQTFKGGWDQLQHAHHTDNMWKPPNDTKSLFMKPDGKQVFLIVDDKIEVYPLNTDYDIASTGTLIASVDPGFGVLLRGIAFKFDGSRMFLWDGSTDDIKQYEVPIPWDVTSIPDFSISTPVFSAPGFHQMEFSFDGKFLYIATDVRLLLLMLNNIWDLGAGGSVSTSTLGGIDIDSITTKKQSDPTATFYVGSNSTQKITEFLQPDYQNLAGVIEVDSVTLDNVSDVDAISIRSNGQEIFVLDSISPDIVKHHISTDWVISTTAYFLDSQPLALDNVRGVDWSIDQNFMYVVDNTTTDIVEYEATTPGDVGSISKTGDTFDISVLDAAPGDLHWSRDGMHLYYFGEATMTIFQLDAASKFRLAGMTYNNVFFEPVIVIGAMAGGYIMGDEKKFYVTTAGASNMIYAFEMPSKGDLANSVQVGSAFDSSGITNNVHAIAVKPDEKQMFLCGTQFDNVDRYILTVRGDPSSAVYQDSLYVGGEEILPFGMNIRPTDGKKLYIVGINSDRVHVYDMSLEFNNAIITKKGQELTTKEGMVLVHK